MSESVNLNSSEYIFAENMFGGDKNNNVTLDHYLLVIPFDFQELNKIHKSYMIQKFKRDRLEGPSYDLQKKGYNTLYDDEAYTSIISKAFTAIVKENFIVSSQLAPIKTWIYVQNKENWSSVWHTHVSTSTVNAVFYINPPEKGGGLSLRLNGVETTIQPKPNYLYVFPYWMEHKPNPQEDEDWRISVNIEYVCSQRAIVKETGVVW